VDGWGVPSMSAGRSSATPLRKQLAASLRGGAEHRSTIGDWRWWARLLNWNYSGRVAQLGERLVRNEEAAGSSPATSTNLSVENSKDSRENCDSERCFQNTYLSHLVRNLSAFRLTVELDIQFADRPTRTRQVSPLSQRLRHVSRFTDMIDSEPP
jgi:hypothetical protein